MDRLKPCPFCGSYDVHITDAWPHYLYCLGCGIKMQPARCDFAEDGVKMTAEAWNRRTEEGAQK